MLLSALRVLRIKDLKDLRFFRRRGAIDMQDLKDLKRFFHVNDRGGNPLACACGRRGPPRYGEKKRAAYRRARACPSPCLDREGNVGWRAFFAQVGRSRGTGNRATVVRRPRA